MAHLKHPDSKQVIEVSPKQVPLYLASGWRKNTSRSSTKASSTTTTATDAKKE